MNRRDMAAGLALVVTATLAGIGLASGAGLTLTHKAASAYKVCVITGVTNNLAVIDTWVPDRGPGNPNSSLAILSQRGNNRRVFIRFDLTKCNPAVPTSATVVTATLRLQSIADADRTIEAHRVMETWAETMNGGNDPDVAAGATTQTLVDRTGVYFEWNVLPDVMSFIAGQATNYGWRLKDSMENSAASPQTVFQPSETTNAAARPQLVIFYTS